LHTGECEVGGNDIGGIAVHIGVRVGAWPVPTTYWSRRLMDLIVGSGLEFEDSGAHELKGGAWRVAAVRRRFTVH
jgi:hypothetical protein